MPQGFPDCSETPQKIDDLKDARMINKVDTQWNHLNGATSKLKPYVQVDLKVSVHLIIKIQKFTSNVQSVPRQSLGIY
jgi:hypothetical protein